MNCLLMKGGKSQQQIPKIFPKILLHHQHCQLNSSEDDDGEIETKDTASLIVTSSRFVVRAKGCEIRVMDKESGKKTGKISV